MSIIYGYCRVSTADQHLEMQHKEVERLGAQIIFQEKQSGKNLNRIELQKLLQVVENGDSIVVYSISRLGRSLLDLCEISQLLEKRGVSLKSAKESIDTSTPTGKFIFGVLASFAQYEREIIIERVKDGIRAAKQRGVHIGRKSKSTGNKLQELAKLIGQGISIESAATNLNISRATAYRWASKVEEGRL